MPIYDYTCSACGHLTEVLHGIYDLGPRFCPDCGAEGTMRKGVTAPAVHFKGTGWAKKDRSSAKGAARPKAEDPKPGSDTAPAGSGASESGASESGASESGSKTTASAESSGGTATPAAGGTD